MRPSSLLATLAVVTAVLIPAAHAQDVPPQPPANSAAAPDDCRDRADGTQVAQIHCCKANKGICGCRAGKIICCDGTASTEAGCTCHGDEAVVD